MNNFLIREINIEELPNATRVVGQAYEVAPIDGIPVSPPHTSDTFHQDILDKKLFIFAAFMGGQMIGTVRYEIKEDSSLYLSQLATLPAYRDKGIGRKLMEYAEGHARKAGHSAMGLGCMREKKLPAYYAAMGYKEIGSIQRPAYEFVKMEKEL